MAFLGGRSAEIPENIYPHTGRQPRLTAITVDFRTNIVDATALAGTNLVQRVPHLRLEPDARTAIRE